MQYRTDRIALCPPSHEPEQKDPPSLFTLCPQRSIGNMALPFLDLVRLSKHHAFLASSASHGRTRGKDTSSCTVNEVVVSDCCPTQATNVGVLLFSLGRARTQQRCRKVFLFLLGVLCEQSQGSDGASDFFYVVQMYRSWFCGYVEKDPTGGGVGQSLCERLTSRVV